MNDKSVKRIDIDNDIQGMRITVIGRNSIKSYAVRFLDVAGLREKYMAAEIFVDGRLRFSPTSLTPI